jgi:hypothetical protein
MRTLHRNPARSIRLRQPAAIPRRHPVAECSIPTTTRARPRPPNLDGAENRNRSKLKNQRTFMRSLIFWLGKALSVLALKLPLFQIIKLKGTGDNNA